jgi:hypothetical protein
MLSLPYLFVTEEGNFLKSAGHLILRAGKVFGAKTRYSTPTAVVKKGEGHSFSRQNQTICKSNLKK